MAPGQEENALAATSPGAKAADGKTAPAVGGSAGGLGDGLGSGISASKFITLPGNAGPKSTLFPHPLERSLDDSDGVDTGGLMEGLHSRRNDWSVQFSGQQCLLPQMY